MCCHGACSKFLKKNYNNNDLGAHCHHCKTAKTKQRLDRTSTSLKHYISLSQNNILKKTKHMTTSLKLDATHATLKLLIINK